jgi:hypothetical protein
MNDDYLMEMAYASALSYENGNLESLLTWQNSKFVSYQRITVGDDSVLICYAGFGVVVAFRGTITNNDGSLTFEDWLNDGDIILRGVPYLKGTVHTGFWRSLMNLWDHGLSELIQKFETVYVTGHSKGGAIATLASRLFQVTNRTKIANVVTFGSPAAGDYTFVKDYNSAIPNNYRYEHRNDVVPHLPLKVPLISDVRITDSIPFDSLALYTHVGQLRFIDWDNKINSIESLELMVVRDAQLLIAGQSAITDHYIWNYIDAILNERIKKTTWQKIMDWLRGKHVSCL